MSYPAPLYSVKLADMKLHHLGHLIKKGPEAPGRPPAEHNAPPHPWLAVLHQQDPPLPVGKVAGRCCGRGLGPLGPPAVMVPDVWAFAGQLHVDWLRLAPVRAEVAAAVLELLQVFYGVDAAGSRHSPHTKWQRHLDVDTHMDMYCILFKV